MKQLYKINVTARYFLNSKHKTFKFTSSTLTSKFKNKREQQKNKISVNFLTRETVQN